jgi:hypothetical protein
MFDKPNAAEFEPSTGSSVKGFSEKRGKWILIAVIALPIVIVAILTITTYFNKIIDYLSSLFS